eukprot:119398_1
MGSALYKFRFANIQHLNIITNTSNSIMNHWMDRFLFIEDLANSAKHDESITTMKPDGQKIRVNVYGKDIILRDAQSDDSLITVCDVKTKNGVDVVIDAIKSSSIILTLGCGKYRLTDLVVYHVY